MNWQHPGQITLAELVAESRKLGAGRLVVSGKNDKGEVLWAVVALTEEPPFNAEILQALEMQDDCPDSAG